MIFALLAHYKEWSCNLIYLRLGKLYCPSRIVYRRAVSSTGLQASDHLTPLLTILYQFVSFNLSIYENILWLHNVTV